jgi:hypothetical protein
MYPTNNTILLKEVIEEDAPLSTGTTPMLYNPTAANKMLRRYEVVDITSNILMGEKHSVAGDIIEVGDIVAVRVKDVEEFFDGLVFTDYDKLVAIQKKGK